MTERTIKIYLHKLGGDFVFVEERMKSIIDVTLTMQQSLHGCLHIEPKNKRTSLYAPYIYWMNFPISPWCENCGNGWWLHNFLRALKLQLPRTASTSNDMMPFSLHGSYKKKRNFFPCIKFFRQRASDVQHLLIHVKASSQKVGLDGGGISKRFSPKRISLLH